MILGGAAENHPRSWPIRFAAWPAATERAGPATLAEHLGAEAIELDGQPEPFVQVVEIGRSLALPDHGLPQRPVDGGATPITFPAVTTASQPKLALLRGFLG